MQNAETFSFERELNSRCKKMFSDSRRVLANPESAEIPPFNEVKKMYRLIDPFNESFNSYKEIKSMLSNKNLKETDKSKLREELEKSIKKVDKAGEALIDKFQVWVEYGIYRETLMKAAEEINMNKVADNNTITVDNNI